MSAPAICSTCGGDKRYVGRRRGCRCPAPPVVTEPKFTDRELRAAAAIIAVLRDCPPEERTNVLVIVCKSWIERYPHSLLYGEHVSG